MVDTISRYFSPYVMDFAGVATVDEHNERFNESPTNFYWDGRNVGMERFVQSDINTLKRQQQQFDGEVTKDMLGLKAATHVLLHFFSKRAFASGKDLSGIALIGLDTPLLDLSGANLTTAIVAGHARKASFVGANLNGAST